MEILTSINLLKFYHYRHDYRLGPRLGPNVNQFPLFGRSTKTMNRERTALQDEMHNKDTWRIHSTPA